MTRVNKEKGLGEIVGFPPIEGAHFKAISEYFKIKMYGNIDPKMLQHIIVLHHLLPLSP